MSEFIDRLGKTAAKILGGDGTASEFQIVSDDAGAWMDCKPLIRAILTEMRDAVTPEMLQNIERELSSQNQCQRVALDVWQAAIDTALKEGQ